MAKKKAKKSKAVKKIEVKPETPLSYWIARKQAFLKGRLKFKTDFIKSMDSK